MPESRQCHLVGVAGSGMSALAQVLIAQGWAVSGSDRFSDQGSDLAILEKLKMAGVRLMPQDGSGITDSHCTVVTSSAVETTNADVVAARQIGCSIVARAEMLARLADGKECIAIAGTSGKTTVTGMVGWVLEQLGRDPTVINGGAVLNWLDDRIIGNVRIGKSGPWVLEADESDRSLLMFKPDWAIITNVGKDHFDLKESEALFARFAGQVGKGVIRPESAADEVEVAAESFAGTEFLRHGVRFSVSLPGRHNVENAMQTIALCERLGIDVREVVAPLRQFRGIERRLQYMGKMNGAVIIDDFAHNPAKIMASWRTVAPHFKRILAVWRPHGFKPLEFMQSELIETIAGVSHPDDRFFVLPVFYAGGTVERRVTSDIFAAGLRARGINALAVADHEACINHISALAGKGDAVLVMGARDPDLPRLARGLAARNAA